MKNTIQVDESFLGEVVAYLTKIDTNMSRRFEDAKLSNLPDYTSIDLYFAQMSDYWEMLGTFIADNNGKLIHIKTLEKLLDRIEELARNILYTNSIRLSKEDYIKSIIDDLRIICASTIEFRNFCYITASKSKNTIVVSSPKKINNDK